MKDQKERKLSAGTLIMLVLTVLVMIGTGLVVIRFSSDQPADMTRVQGNEDKTEQPGTSVPEKPDENDIPETGDSAYPTSPYSLQTAGTAEETAAGRHFTLTVAGTVSVAGEVRKNSYISEVKVYDFTDIMTLLKSELRSDLNIVFLENILSHDGKVNDTSAPEQVAELLSSAGFHMAACGFSKAWAAEEAGISSTREKLSEKGIIPVGIREASSGSRIQIEQRNGIRIAVMQYTDSISESIRKKMSRREQADTVPAADAEQIAADILEARGMGAEAVIILINWEKIGKKQRSLVQQIADAGADLIIGSGTGSPSGAETICATHKDGSLQNVICIWSLGTVLSGEQKNIKNRSGYLFHAVITADSSGNIVISDPEFTPLYTWRYKQDGRYYYRCLAANRSVPDGMDSEQAKSMEKAADTTREALKDSPLSER